MTPDALKPLLGLLVNYLLGAIPFGYLIGKMKGVDIRQHGSGNLGATNAFRVLGRQAGTAVLILDIAKGTLAVLLADKFFRTPAIGRDFFLCLCALSAVAGHNWTVFLNFKGGKGVATSLGILIAFAILIERFPWVIAGVVSAWLVVFLASGFVSLASLVASCLLPFLAVFFCLPNELIALLTLLAVFSVIRHKPNISRLLQKTESRFDTQALLRKFSKKTLPR